MHKTTAYLPDDLERAMERVRVARGSSEAALVREAVRTRVREAVSPRPRLPLNESRGRGLAERVDQALTGFGRR